MNELLGISICKLFFFTTLISLFANGLLIYWLYVDKAKMEKEEDDYITNSKDSGI